MKVKILIPTLNEEKNITKVVKDFKNLGQLIVCDNNSTDKTTTAAKQAGAKVVFERRKGKGYAVRKLLEEDADVYVLVDGDNAFYAEDCERMIDLIKKKKADMVIGKRLNINAHSRGSYSLRRVCLPFLITLFNIKFRKNEKINDFLSGFRMFTNEVKEKLNLESKGFDIETEITIQALKNNFRVVEIPVKIKPRKFGKQKSNIFNVGFPVLKRILFSCF